MAKSKRTEDEILFASFLNGFINIEGPETYSDRIKDVKHEIVAVMTKDSPLPYIGRVSPETPTHYSLKTNQGEALLPYSMIRHLFISDPHA